MSKYFCGTIKGVCGLKKPTAKKKGFSSFDSDNSNNLFSAHTALISSGVRSLFFSLIYLNSL